MLTHAKVKDIAQPSTLPQLIVTFKCGYCPKGLFGTFITYLIANEMCSGFHWELLTDQIFRDEVSFQVGPHDIITLRFLPTHLEITCAPSNPDLPRKHCTEEEVCKEVCQSVEQGIKTVTSAISYINAQHSFTFYCTASECISNPHPAKPMKLGNILCTLMCDRSKQCLQLPPGHEKWQLDSMTCETKATATITTCIRKEIERIDKCQLSVLISQLTEQSAEWKEIGTYLGFHEGELANIAGTPNLIIEGPKGCLRTMLSKWLEWAPGDHRKSTQYATLEALKTAVDNAGFGVTASELTLTRAPGVDEALRASGNAAATVTEDITSKNKRRVSTEEEPRAKRPRTE